MSPDDRSKPPHAAPPDPDDPPSDDEIRAAEALRLALEGSRREGGAPARTATTDGEDPIGGRRDESAEATRRDVELLAAIRAASVPTSISAEKNRALLDRALTTGVRSAGGSSHEGKVVPLSSRRNRAVLAAGGVAGLLAMAAAVALVVRSQEPAREVALTSAPARTIRGVVSVPRHGAPPTFAMARSTADLFPEGIPRSGGTTARIDRIASARAQDFRQNQFARWRTR